MVIVPERPSVLPPSLQRGPDLGSMAAWQQKHGSFYLPDMRAASVLHFHRTDDPLYSILEVSPRAMLNYEAYCTYDTLDELIQL